jgi:hypothetical protein
MQPFDHKTGRLPIRLFTVTIVSLLLTTLVQLLTNK